jgi:hypothetical protein
MAFIRRLHDPESGRETGLRIQKPYYKTELFY